MVQREQDLQQRVAESLARFDNAVKESTRLSEERPETRSWHEELEDRAIRIEAAAEGERPPGKARCRPWDYEEFILRLQTFTPLNWFAKPSFASPPLCACYGWIVGGRDTLCCECCGAHMEYAPVNKNQGTDDSDEKDLEVDPAPFASRLKSEHHDLCPWNGNACPAEFLHLPPMAADDLRSEFLARLRSLVPLTDKQAPSEAPLAMPEVCLPEDFEEHCPGRLSALAPKARALMADESSSSSAIVPKGTSTQGKVAQMEGEAEPRGDSACSKSKRGLDIHQQNGLERFGDGVVGTAAAIAVFGWQSAPGDGKHKLKCTLCNRRLATDNFLAIEAGSRANSSAESDKGMSGLSSQAGSEGSGRRTKRRRVSGGGTPLKAMDLAAEHRSFCPWAVIHPPMSGETPIQGALPGWRQALDAVLRWREGAEAIAPPAENERFSTAATDKAEEALQKVQKVLGVLMRY